MMHVWKISPGQTQELPPIELRYDGEKVIKRVVIHNTKKVSEHLVIQDEVGAYHIFFATGGLVSEISPLEEVERVPSDRV